jgi:hypothetical protein
MHTSKIAIKLVFSETQHSEWQRLQWKGQNQTGYNTLRNVKEQSRTRKRHPG